MKNQLELVKVGNYIVPRNASTYKKFVKLGITHTRLSEPSFQTIVELVLQKKGYTGVVKPFSEVWQKFIDRLSNAISKVPGFSLSKNRNTLRIESIDPKQKTRVDAAILKIKNLVDGFARRWGSLYEYKQSESRGRQLLVVKFDHARRVPVIAVSPEYEHSKDPIVIDLGFNRIEIYEEPESTSSFRRLEVKVKCGPKYKTIHTSRFLKTEMVFDPQIQSLIYS